MKNIVENQGIKTDKPLAMSYEALKAERDALADRVNALAVENAALKQAGNKMFLSAISLMEDPELKIDHSRDIKDWERNETPATDAAFAAIRSDYMAEGAEIVARKAQVIYQERHKSGDFESAGKYLTTIKFANNIAADIREAK